MGRKEFFAQKMFEGTGAEKTSEHQSDTSKARELSTNMPTSNPERLLYIKGLEKEVLNDQLDIQIFQRFLDISDSKQLYYDDVRRRQKWQSQE